MAGKKYGISNYYGIASGTRLRTTQIKDSLQGTPAQYVPPRYAEIIANEFTPVMFDYSNLNPNMDQFDLAQLQASWPLSLNGRTLHPEFVNVLTTLGARVQEATRGVTDERDALQIADQVMSTALGINAEGVPANAQPPVGSAAINGANAPQEANYSHAGVMSREVTDPTSAREISAGELRRVDPQTQELLRTARRGNLTEEFLNTWRRMTYSVGPVFLRIPPNWRQYDNNPEQAAVEAFQQMLIQQLEQGRAGQLPNQIDSTWLFGIQLPQIRMEAGAGGGQPRTVVSRNTVKIRNEADVRSAAVTDFLRRTVEGRHGEGDYNDQNYHNYIQNMFGDAGPGIAVAVLPVIYDFVDNVRHYTPENSSEPLDSALARRKDPSPISVIFKNYGIKHLESCLNRLLELNLFLPDLSLIPDARKHCMLRSLLTCYLLYGGRFTKKRDLQRELRRYVRKIQKYAKGKGINITNLTPRQFVAVLPKLRASLPPLPRELTFISDSTGSKMSTQRHNLISAPYGYTANIWLMEGNTHAIPLVPSNSPFAANYSSTIETLGNPPHFEVNDLLMELRDMRPDVLITFDYETLNPGRSDPTDEQIFTRKVNPDGPQLVSSPVQDYMISWCISDGKDESRHLDDSGLQGLGWEADYHYREDSTTMNCPTYVFLRKLTEVIKELPSNFGEKDRYSIQLWAHNTEFDLSIFNRDYLEWYTNHEFKNTGLYWGLPEISCHNNRYIYVKITVKDLESGSETTLVFKDSFNIMPMSLAALCGSMAVPEEFTKGDLDHAAIRTLDDVRENEGLITPYAMNDVLSLMYILKEFCSQIDSTFGKMSPETEHYLQEQIDYYLNLENPTAEEGKLIKTLAAVSEQLDNDELDIHIGLGSYTTAGLSRKIMKLNIFHILVEERMSLNMKDDALFRQAYRGGRVQCFEIGKFNGPIHYLDFTSLYPTTMLQKTIRGQGREVTAAPFGENEHGIAEVEYYIDGEPAWTLPLLCETIEHHGLVALRPSISEPQTGMFTSNELKLAEQNGYHITYKRKWVFQCDRWLAGLTKQLYKLKQTAESDGNAPLRQIAKLIINSAYGFWALKHGRSDIELDIVDDQLLKNLGMTESNIKKKLDRTLKNLWKKMFGDTLVRTTTLVDRYLLTETTSNRIAPFQNVAVAAWITANARIKLWKLLRLLIQHGKRPLYCDTDSVIFQGKLTKALAKILKQNKMPVYGMNCDTNELGCLTNELDDNPYADREGCPHKPGRNYADHAFILGLKQYCLHSERPGCKRPKDTKKAMKGIPLKRKFIARKTDPKNIFYISHGRNGEEGINECDYRDLAGGNSRYLNVLYDSFSTGLSEVWAQPLTRHLQLPGNPRPNAAIKDFQDCTRRFDLRYRECTRRCGVGYLKGPLIDHKGFNIPLNKRGKPSGRAMQRALKQGPLKVGYFKSKTEPEARRKGGTP